MRRILGLTALLALLGSPGLAMAQDEDKDTGKDEEEEKDEEPDTKPPKRIEKKDLEEEEEDTAPAPKRLETEDKGVDEEPADDELDFEDEEGEKIDFQEDEEEPTTLRARGPGEDTAELYREAQKKAKEMSVDEEILSWERYLKKYPKSLFKKQIEERMDGLSSEMMGERVPGSDRGATSKDAAKRELNFAVPLQYSPIDTRTRLSAGVELGIPNWFGPRLDFEWAFLRQFSAHAGLRQEYTNFALVTGAKYALVKSARTGTLLTGGVDLKLYTGPAYIDVRPMVGFGQRFDVMDGLDVQAQIAVDVEARDPAGIRYFGGFGAELRPNSTVSVFAETSMNFKYIGNDDFNGPFRFLITTFGLRFNAAKPKNEDGDGKLDIGLGANVPYSTNYWGFYEGAITANADYYL